MTGRLEVSYRSPTPLHTPLRFEAWVENVAGRKITAKCTLHAGDRLCAEATGLFSLLRNLGSSIGISAVIMLLSRNTQINHAALSEYVTPLDPAWRALLPDAWSLDTASGLAALDAEVTRQAATIAYLTDFQLMMWVTILAIPLVFLLRRTRRGPASTAAIVD